MDPVLEAALIQIESLKLKVLAIEKALPNLKGFYVEKQDGSQEGQIKYNPVPVPTDPAPVDPEPAQAGA